MSEKKLQQLLSRYLVHQDQTEIEQYIEAQVKLRSGESDPLDATQRIEPPNKENTWFPASPKEDRTIVQQSPSTGYEPSSDLTERKTPFPTDAEMELFETGFRTGSFHNYDPTESKSYLVDEEGLNDPNKLGSYDKRKQIGKGAMGSVWRVQDPTLYREIALKVINTEHGSEELERGNFIKEAQISAQLQHPGIVPVYELNSLASGHLYFTMKEIKGRTLKEVMKTVHNASRDGVWRSASDGWNFRKLISAFHSVCRTIEYAHSRGVIHCDLKPSNIMIGDYGEVLVVDWGIARLLNDPNNPYQVQIQSMPDEPDLLISGTPVYMSPEQASGLNHLVGTRSDIYCLGSTLYHILRGAPPFRGTEWSIMSSKCTGDPVSVREPAYQHQSPRPLADELVNACEKAMTRLPENRFQHVSELADAIEEWLEGLQRRDKALQILDRVQELEEKRTQLKAVQNTEWNRAQRALSTSLTSEEGWKHWEKAQSCLDQVNQIQLEIEQQLHGALIYDSQLTQIHDKLAHIEFTSYIEAHMREDSVAKKRYYRRFQTYIDVLPKEKKEKWELRLQTEDNSIAFNRRKRGVFVGREEAVQELVSRLKEHNCVCLIGSAGVGKTHVALEVGTKWKEENHKEVFFCDLTAARDLLSAYNLLGECFDLTLNSNNPKEQILSFLETHKPLLLLDNVEQIIGPITDFIRSLRQESPQTTLLVTSRIPPAINQEYMYSLQPMNLLEGILLFAERARTQRSGFVVNRKNRVQVARLVQKLDSIPLAIELAAARISTLRLEEIENKLSDRYSLLRGRVRSSEQKTLLGAVEWSWELLSTAEQLVFAQCGVFQGGFDLPAAEAVLNQETSDSTMDQLEALIDDSLLRKEEQADGSVRYYMLKYIHDFARQKHAQLTPQIAVEKHAEYFSKRVVQLKENPSMQSAYVPLHKDLSNLIVASEKGSPIPAHHCCLGALEVLRRRGPASLAIQITDTFLARDGLDEESAIPVQLERIAFLRINGRISQAREEVRSILTQIQQLQSQQ
ncbi:MAG: protein kinase [Myxococcota bacterium]|nr:protein kinase [Myxococcota bacterium]